MSDLIRYEVTGIYDGDTLTARDAEGVERRIRLSEIDTPELGPLVQAGGREALEFVNQFLSPGSKISFSPSGKQSFGREVGSVFLENGQNLGKQLLAQGLANMSFQMRSDESVRAAYNLGLQRMATGPTLAQLRAQREWIDLPNNLDDLELPSQPDKFPMDDLPVSPVAVNKWLNAAVNEWYGALGASANAQLRSAVRAELMENSGEPSNFDETAVIRQMHALYPDEFTEDMSVRQADAKALKLVRMTHAKFVQAEEGQLRHMFFAAAGDPTNLIGFGAGRALSFAVRGASTFKRKVARATLLTMPSTAASVGISEAARVSLDPTSSPQELAMTLPIGIAVGSLFAGAASIPMRRVFTRSQMGLHRVAGQVATGRAPC